MIPGWLLNHASCTTMMLHSLFCGMFSRGGQHIVGEGTGLPHTTSVLAAAASVIVLGMTGKQNPQSHSLDTESRGLADTCESKRSCHGIKIQHWRFQKEWCCCMFLLTKLIHANNMNPIANSVNQSVGHLQTVILRIIKRGIHQAE